MESQGWFKPLKIIQIFRPYYWFPFEMLNFLKWIHKQDFRKQHSTESSPKSYKRMKVESWLDRNILQNWRLPLVIHDPYLPISDFKGGLSDRPIDFRPSSPKWPLIIGGFSNGKEAFRGASRWENWKSGTWHIYLFPKRNQREGEARSILKDGMKGSCSDENCTYLYVTKLISH